jgi:2-haloacid dehalogenase
MATDRFATFDCYGTLIDWNGGIRTTLARLFGEADADALVVRYHELEPVVEAERYRSYREVLDLVTGMLARERGRELAAGDATAMSESLADWPAFPEVPAALADAVGRGWRLVILSNCDRDLIATSVPKLGVEFADVIVADDVGSYKPAHGHWNRFAERYPDAAGRHVHVGASRFHDIAPAAELRLPSVWINRLNEPPDPRALRELTDLSGLPDTLDELLPA